MNIGTIGRTWHTRGVSLLVALGLLLTMTAGPAHGQSAAELQRENQALKDQVRNLEEQLKASQDQVRQLRAEVARLRGGADAGTASTGDVPAVSIDETVPSASPRALFNAVQASYEENIKTADMGRDANDKARELYLRSVRTWTQKVNREMRSPITWRVRVLDNQQRGNQYVTRLEAIDPETGIVLGDAFEVSVNRTIGSRIDAMADRNALEPLELRGVLVPAVAVNEERTKPGAFNNPPYIGPFAEFGYTIEVQSLAAPAKAASKTSASGEPAAKP